MNGHLQLRWNDLVYQTEQEDERGSVAIHFFLMSMIPVMVDIGFL